MKIRGGMEVTNEIRELGRWRGGMYSIKLKTTTPHTPCPEYGYEHVEDKKEMYINLIYCDEVFIDIISSEYIVLADRSGYINIIDLDEIDDEDATLIKKVFRSPSRKLFRDGKETLKFLKDKKITVCGEYFDISLASQLLEFGSVALNNTADIVAKHLTENEYYTVNDANKINHIINNCKLIFKLEDILRTKLQESEMLEIAEVEFKCLDAIVEMETTGIYFDKELWKEAKKYSKQNIDYTKYINPNTSKIHATFNQIGTATGRVTTSSPSIQNVSREERVRACFKAAEGNVLIIGDYSQVELRVVAEATNEGVMIEAFKSNTDLHAFTASKVLGKEIQYVTREERQAAKAINFGLIYGMGPAGLVKYAKESFNTDISEDKAAMFIVTFFETYPGIKAWHNNANKSKADGAKTVGGRIRKWDSPPLMRSLCNSKVQGTASDMMKKSLGNLIELRKFYNLRFSIVNVVHDEIIIEAYDIGENVKRTEEVLRKAMIEAGEFYLKKVPIEVSITTGEDWSAK